MRLWCGAVGLAAAFGSAAAGVFDPAEFFPVYLLAALAWLHVSMGCLLLGWIHRLTGGAWGETLAPFLAAGTRTAPWAILFAAPVLAGWGYLFSWGAGHGMHPVYLSAKWYAIRAILYAFAICFLLWISRANPGSRWAGPVGMIVHVVTIYLLSVDWVMALEPGWVSSGFPVIFLASQALCALALGIGTAVWRAGGAPASEGGSMKAWKDIGNLLLACLLFWAYVSYGQFLIVWSSNLPREAAWYIHRDAGGWHALVILLALFQLLAPALLLLSNRTKRRSPRLGWLALGVFAGQAAYLCWLILPSFRPRGIDFHWLDVLPTAAAAGFAFFFYLGGLPTEEPANPVLA